jgi:hypothetical protein
VSAWECGDDTTVGDLTIDGFAMNTPAWRVVNLFELWLPAPQRGQDVIRPGVDGSYAVRRFRATRRVSLQMFVSGEVDAFGDPYSDPFAGMAANLYAFNVNLVAPTGTGDGTRSMVLTLPDGWTRTGDVHVTGMEVSEMRRNARYCYATIEVSIPGGELGIPTAPDP